MDKESVEALLKLACDFQGESLKRREVSRETYLQNEEQHESSIRILIDGLMAKLTNVMIEKKVKDTDERKSYQINVLASVVRTHYLINNLIMDGDLVEAQILIRKQLESLTRLDELDSASLQQLPKGTPNVNNRFRNLYKTAYIPLSEVAHFGSPKVSRFLDRIEKGDLVGPNIHPSFQNEAFGCYELHACISIYILHSYIEVLKKFYEDYNVQEDESIFEIITSIAFENEMIKMA